MSDEEALLRVHPLRQASIFIYAPLVIMDTFLLVFTTVLLAEKLGANPFWAGVISTTAPAVSMPMGLFWGWMADKYGRRLPLIVSGIFSVPALLSFTLATESWHLVVASAVRGIGGSAGLLISRVLVADLAPRKALGERLATLLMAMSATPLIAFTFSGVLYEMDYRLPFITAAILEAVALLLAVFVIPETLVKRKPPMEVMGVEEREFPRMDQSGNGAMDWFLALTRRGAALYTLNILVGSLLVSVPTTIAFPSIAVDLGLSPTQISLVYTFGMMIGLLSFIPSAILSDMIGRKWPVLFAGFLGALAWLLYLLVPGMAAAGIAFPGLLLINLVSGVASGLGGPAFLAYFFEWIPMRGRGRASAVTEFFKDLISVVDLLFSLLIGFSFSTFYAMLPPESIFCFAGITGIIVYVIVWVAWQEAPLPEGKWKMRKLTIALIVVEILLAAFVVFQFREFFFQ